jgi:hypothetical protein
MNSGRCPERIIGLLPYRLQQSAFSLTLPGAYRSDSSPLHGSARIRCQIMLETSNILNINSVQLIDSESKPHAGEDKLDLWWS